MAGKIDAKARWKYNARDCAATIGAFNVLCDYLTGPTEMVYRAQMALEHATLAIQSRGIKINGGARDELLLQLREEFKAKVQELHADAGEPVNPNSPDQVKRLFYEMLKLTECRNKDGKVSVDREVLERIVKCRVDPQEPLPRGQKQPHLQKCSVLAAKILDARGINKDMAMVKAKLDKGRMRTSINVGATESFRFSASKTNFGTGANLQQVKRALRTMFVPDAGMLIGYMDQDRAESHVVAHVSGDPAYIAAHEAHDTHVEVCKLIWPDAGWTEDDHKNLELAEEPNFLRFFSRRDLSKRVQHASNYMAVYRTLARLLGISEHDAKNIQDKYFEAYPGIRTWQQEIVRQVKQYQRIWFPGGFYRDFFGRPWDEATHREAISCLPQAVVAWTNHIVMYRIWKYLEEAGLFEVLMHNHDAVVFQTVDWEKHRPKVEALSKVMWPGKHGPFSLRWSYDVGDSWAAVS